MVFHRHPLYCTSVRFLWLEEQPMSSRLFCSELIGYTLFTVGHTHIAFIRAHCPPGRTEIHINLVRWFDASIKNLHFTFRHASTQIEASVTDTGENSTQLVLDSWQSIDQTIRSSPRHYKSKVSDANFRHNKTYLFTSGIHFYFGQ